jgi:hypothetical protein
VGHGVDVGEKDVSRVRPFLAIGLPLFCSPVRKAVLNTFETVFKDLARSAYVKLC